MDKLIRFLGGVPNRKYKQLEEDYNDLLQSFNRLMEANSNYRNQQQVDRITVQPEKRKRERPRKTPKV